MHALLFLTFNREKANTPQEAQQYAIDFLESTGFAGDEGIADWFEVGGRWSGALLGWDKIKPAPFGIIRGRAMGYDAQIVTREIFDRIIKGSPEGLCDVSERAPVVDVECETKKRKNYVDRKWIVVIDYHC